MKTLKFHLKKLNKEQFQKLNFYCHRSNSLYNSAVYICKKHFEETGKYIGYLKLYHKIKNDFNYKSLPSKIAQQTLRVVDSNHRSFFNLLKMKKSGNFKNKISTPKYKPKKSQFNLILPNDQIKVKNNILKITKDIKLPFNYNIDGKIKQAIIKPKGKKYYEMFISYEENQKEKLQNLNENHYLSLDLGVNNFASCFSNVGPCFLIQGGVLKSTNQFYNKRKAEIQGELFKLNQKKKWSHKLSRLNIKRDNVINNFFNQSISKILKFCKKHKIRTIVCGYNKSWKQKINIGKRNNQNFQSIPYFKFKKKLENKCNELGIRFLLQEESYTSKCSFLDNEEIKKHSNYLGKRIKRGLFQTRRSLKVNSDMNASANILKKAFPNFKLKDGIEVFIVKPLVLNPFQPKKFFNRKLFH